MSDESKLFDQQIHDAYEGVRLSEAAQDRMLANLLAAQAQRAEQGEESAASAATESVPATEVRPRAKAAHLKVQNGDNGTGARRRAPWKVVLPLAAVLLVGVVVVSLQSTKPKHAAATADSSAAPLSAQKEAETDAAGGTETYDLSEETPLAAMDESVAEEEAEDAAVESELVETDPDALVSADLYVRITMEDGTALTTLVDGSSTQEVNPERIGEQVGKATAAPFDSPSDAVPCTVFSLVGDTEGFAVRYEGDAAYWYAVPL